MPDWSPAVPSASEEAQSFREGISFTNQNSTVDLRVPWADRYTLANDLILNYRQHPYTPTLRATNAAIRPAPNSGYTTNGQSMDYDEAIVSVTYSIPGKDGQPQDPTDLVSESLEPTLDYRTYSHRGLQWDTGAPLGENDGPAVLTTGLNIVRTFYRLTVLPASALTLPGKVNNAIYNSALLGLSFAAETLLFHPPTLDRTVNAIGGFAWTVQSRMQFKSGGWNRFKGPDGQLREIQFSNGGATFKPYIPDDFSDWLF